MSRNAQQSCEIRMGLSHRAETVICDIISKGLGHYKGLGHKNGEASKFLNSVVAGSMDVSWSNQCLSAHQVL